jgi:hypothetical protein
MKSTIRATYRASASTDADTMTGQGGSPSIVPSLAQNIVTAAL